VHGPRREAACKGGDAVPVNNSTAGTKQGMDEYQRLTTELEDVKK